PPRKQRAPASPRTTSSRRSTFPLTRPTPATRIASSRTPQPPTTKRSNSAEAVLLSRPPRWLLGVGLLVAAAIIWFRLGMHPGLLLSEDIRSRLWPWPPFFPKRELVAPALSDPVKHFVPWLAMVRRELVAGRLPLWNPHQDGGVPLLGNGQTSMGSPLLWPVLAFGVAAG